MAMLRLVSGAWMLANYASAMDTDTNNSTSEGAIGGDEEVEPGVAVLFPWFSLAIGSFAYFALSRYMPWMPYTAVMFILGTIISVSAVRLVRVSYLTESIGQFWLKIN